MNFWSLTTLIGLGAALILPRGSSANRGTYEKRVNRQGAEDAKLPIRPQAKKTPEPEYLPFLGVLGALAVQIPEAHMAG